MTAGGTPFLSVVIAVLPIQLHFLVSIEPSADADLFWLFVTP